jgi:predicted permease
MRGWRGLGIDVRLVTRGLRRAPGFALTAILVLAVTVAVNSAVFAFVRGTLLQAPPYRSPDRLVLAWGSNPVNGQLRDVISGSNFIDLRERASTLAPLAAFHEDDVAVMRDGRPLVVTALEVTVDFLQVLGVTPLLGSDFGPHDRISGARPAALVAHGFWQDALGGRTDLVGSTIEVDGRMTTIIGVLPEGFRFAGTSSLYIPLRDDELKAEDRTHHHYHLVGRLRPGASAGAATRELSGILAGIAAQDPRLTGWSVLVEPMMAVTVEAVRPALWLIAGAVLLVFVVAVVNLGMLFRVRTLERIGELAMRSALGAPPSRIVGTILTEALGLSALGGAIGLVLAPIALDLLSSIAPPRVLIPHSAAAIPVLRATLEPGLLATAFAGALVAGLLLSMPSLATSIRVAAGLSAWRSGDRITGAYGSRWLIGAEIALATLLCVAAGLTMRSVDYLASRDMGVETNGVLTTYVGDVEDRPIPERAEYFRQVIAAVEAIPGVVRAGTNDYRPFEGEDDFKGLRFRDRPVPPPGQAPREEWRRVSEGYFAAAGMRVVRGRGFLPEDFLTTPRAVVINRAFAAKYYPDRDPIGRRLMVGEPGYTDVAIVGVVADVLSRGPMEPPPPVLYAPYQASPRGHVALFARVAGDPMMFATAVRDAIWSVDSRQPVLPVIPFEEVVRRSMAIPTMMSQIVGAMAMVALMLSSLGLVGVVGFAVRSRFREFGVRMVLGASPNRLTLGVIGGLAPVVVLALVSGAVAAYVGLGGLRALLHGVAPTDPLSFAAAIGLVAGVSLGAIWLPARRVATIDPARVIQEG